MHIDVNSYLIDITKVIAVSDNKPNFRNNDSKYTIVFGNNFTVDVLESFLPRDKFVQDWISATKAKPKAKAKKVTKSE